MLKKIFVAVLAGCSWFGAGTVQAGERENWYYAAQLARQLYTQIDAYVEQVNQGGGGRGEDGGFNPEVLRFGGSESEFSDAGLVENDLAAADLLLHLSQETRQIESLLLEAANLFPSFQAYQKRNQACWLGAQVKLQATRGFWLLRLPGPSGTLTPDVFQNVINSITQIQRAAGCNC